MKIYFVKREGVKTPFSNNDRIELYPDSWNDFGYQTTFKMQLFLKNKSYELPIIKILVEKQNYTHSVFKEILTKGNENFILFPIENLNFISLPTDTEFYMALGSLLEKAEIIQILTDLHDASYIKNTTYLQNLQFMLKDDGFEKSLIRDMTSKKALDTGWLLIEHRTLDKEIDFELNFKLDTFENNHQIHVNFRKSIFPNNINILIGSNGIGKSQTLKYFIEQLLGIETALPQSEKIPIFNQIVVIAYSPFENYRTNLNNTNLTIKTVYKYFGFRNDSGIFDTRLPYRKSIENIKRMLKEDVQKDYLAKRPNKYNTFISVISSAISFDYLGFELDREVDWQPQNDNRIIDKKFYMIVDKNTFLKDDFHIFDDHCSSERGIVFFKNGKKIELSSGQEIFSHMISSIIGSIRDDTILLIDEPEVFLHPNLEVVLIEMLQKILKIYDSYAMIATHSSIFVREIAKDYIIVLKKINNLDQIANPPFETFGGDMERINSYIFFDKDIEKPFEKWLEQLVQQEKSLEIAIEKYKNIVNEESLILMLGMEHKNAN